MFDMQCEKAMFAENPAVYLPEDLGFTELSREPELQNKIHKIKPTEFVNYHDLCEMWKRRQQIDIPFVCVGSYVEVKLKAAEAQNPLLFSGLCIYKEHHNVSAHITLRRACDPGKFNIAL